MAQAVERSGNDLDLRSQGLRALPPNLCERESLVNLDLSSNQIGDLTNEIGWLQAPPPAPAHRRTCSPKWLAPPTILSTHHATIALQ